MKKAIRLCRKNIYSEALENINKSLQYDNLSVFAYRSRGLIYFEMLDYENSIKNFDFSISLNPEAKTYLLRGLTFVQMDNNEKAIESYQKAKELDPERELLGLYGRFFYGIVPKDSW